MRVALTGHRPKDSESEKIVRIKVRVKLSKNDSVSGVISGVCDGFDLWAGDEALSLDIPVWCAVPWRGHKPGKGFEEVYQRLLDRAEKVHYISERKTYPGPQIYHERNHWMVDNSDAVLAYWNPEKTSGGTYHCRKYAKEVAKKPVANIYHDPPF